MIERFVLVSGIICLVLFLILTINTIMFVHKNENVQIEKIRKNLSFRISLSIVLMVIIGVLSIVYIILRNI